MTCFKISDDEKGIVFRCFAAQISLIVEEGYDEEDVLFFLMRFYAQCGLDAGHKVPEDVLKILRINKR